MKSYFIFLKKEVVEFFKTWKFLIMLILFLSSSVLAPILTYIMPTLWEKIGFNPGDEMSDLFSRTMNTSYTQYISNQMQMGFLAIVFITCLAIVREKSKGTAVLTLTKNISRTSFILAKFTSYAFWYTLIYVISYAVFVGLTQLLIKESFNTNALQAILIFYLAGLFYVTSSIFASCIGKNTLVSCLIGFAIYALNIIFAAIPYLRNFAPGTLINLSVTALNGDFNDLLEPLITTLILIPVLLISGVVVFSKQEL